MAEPDHAERPATLRPAASHLPGRSRVCSRMQGVMIRGRRPRTIQEHAMASDSRIRASDADRDRTAAALREHLAAGRLTTEEFDERLDKAYAAKTLGEFDDLTADLPGTDLEQLAGRLAAARCRQPAVAGAFRRVNRGPAGQVLPGVAGGLGILARDQPLRFRDLAGQRGEWRPVVPVGGRAAGRPAAGALDHGCTCPQRAQARPATAEPPASRQRPGTAVTAAQGAGELVNTAGGCGRAAIRRRLRLLVSPLGGLADERRAVSRAIWPACPGPFGSYRAAPPARSCGVTGGRRTVGFRRDD